MNGLTQGKIALIVSSSLLFIQWTVMVWIYYQISPFYIGLFLLPVCSAVFIYFLILILAEYFILRKIRILYRTMSSIGQKMDRDSLKDPELFEQLREKVVQFQHEKTSEIEALRQNEKYRREFLGNVSHELKTPLTSIQGFVEILLEEAKSGKPAEEKYLMKISKNSDRLLEIVQDLTFINQIENNQLDLHWSRFSIYELSLEVIDALEELAKKHHSKIAIKDLQHIHYMVWADRQKIFQVLYNLIENAVHYCPDGSKINLRFFDLDTTLMVEVSDNGNGIEKEHLSRIFERFYRVETDRSRAKGGSGLGLSIVKKIIEAHQQTIRVDSEVGRGTKFIFTLQK